MKPARYDFVAMMREREDYDAMQSIFYTPMQRRSLMTMRTRHLRRGA